MIIFCWYITKINALASHAGTIVNNAYKYNAGTELTEDLDVDYYETYLRQYDAQVGRFTGVDVLSEMSFNISTYAYATNDPIYFNDPSGALAAAFPVAKTEPDNAPSEGGETSSDPSGSGWWMDFGWMFSYSGMGGGYGGSGGGGSGYGGPGGGGGGSSSGQSVQNKKDDNPALPVFNLNALTKPEADKFNSYVQKIKTAPIGQALIAAVSACGKTIFLTHNETHGGAFAEYGRHNSVLNIGDKLSADDYAEAAVLEAIVHEVFHAFQNFSNIPEGSSVEPDAYIAQTVFDIQMGYEQIYADQVKVESPTNDAQKNFNNAWDNFFNNGYSTNDYQAIFDNFIDGSRYGSGYAGKGQANALLGGYLIFLLLCF